MINKPTLSLFVMIFMACMTSAHANDLTQEIVIAAQKAGVREIIEVDANIESIEKKTDGIVINFDGLVHIGSQYIYVTSFSWKQPDPLLDIPVETKQAKIFWGNSGQGLYSGTIIAIVSVLDNLEQLPSAEMINLELAQKRLSDLGTNASIYDFDNDIFVLLNTESGEILIEMITKSAPGHVSNFLHLGSNRFYNGTAFHRVIPGFMIQGGDPLTKNQNRADDGTGGPEWSDVLAADDFAALQAVSAMLEHRGYAGLPAQAAVKAEFNDTSHLRGVLSMARSQSPDSGGSQFFICVADVTHLDGKYTAFGRVIMGMDVVDDIVAVDRDRNDNPLQPILITGFTVLEGLDALSDEQRAAREGERTDTVTDDTVGN